jgi:hypothetical protein
MGSVEGERQGCIGAMNVGAGLEEKTMHLLPCGTNYTGPAAVDDYFKIKAAGETGFQSLLSTPCFPT